MSARLVSEALAMLCLTRAPGAAQVSGLSSRIEQSSQQRLNEFWARILSAGAALSPSPVAVGLQLSFYAGFSRNLSLIGRVRRWRVYGGSGGEPEAVRAEMRAAFS